MKNLFVLLALLFSFANVYAQGLEFVEQEIKGLDQATSAHATFLDKRDGLTLLITNRSASNRSNLGSGIMLLGINENGKVEKSLEISKLRECILVTCTSVGDTAYMIACGAIKGHDFDFYRLKVDIASWTVVGSPELVYEHKNTKADWTDWAIATSPDGHVHAISIKVVNEQSRIAKAFGKKDEESDVLLVTDDKLQTIWQRDDLPSWYSSLTIDNEECVHAILAGVNGDKTYFLFANHNSYGDETFMDSVNRSDIMSIQLINHVDGHFIAGGTIGEDHSAMRNTEYTGIYALSYNTQSSKLTFNPHTLNSTERTALKNVSRMLGDELQGLTVKEGVPTPFGGILQCYTTMLHIYYTNGTPYYIYQMGGSLIAAIDTNANFVWKTPIRNSISSSGTPVLLNQQVLYRNGKTYIVQTESAKNPATYSSTERITALTQMPPTKSMLAIYAIDDNGAVTKQTLPLKKTLFFTGKVHNLNGDFFITVGQLKKVRMIHIKGF